jgi:hypothetical protein
MWHYGLSALVTPVVRRVGASALGWGRSLFFSTVAQTATFVAVDKVTDLVIKKNANEEPTIAEMALDIMLTAFIYRKGGQALSAARARATTIRTNARTKFTSFAESFGRTPMVDLSSFGRKFSSYIKTKRPDVTWAFSKSTGKLHMFGRRSGRYYGSVGNEGISIPGVKKLDHLRVVLKDPKVALTTAGLTTTGLSLLADSLFFLADELHGVDPKDVRDPRSTELGDKLSFLRDPDHWLDEFGSESTPADVALERALDWFFSAGTDGAEIIEVDDESEIDKETLSIAEDYVKEHVDGKTGQISEVAAKELAADDRIGDLHELQCSLELACSGVARTVATVERQSEQGYSYHSAYPGSIPTSKEREDAVVSTLPGLQ